MLGQILSILTSRDLKILIDISDLREDKTVIVFYQLIKDQYVVKCYIVLRGLFQLFWDMITKNYIELI